MLATDVEVEALYTCPRTSENEIACVAWDIPRHGLQGVWDAGTFSRTYESNHDVLPHDLPRSRS